MSDFTNFRAVYDELTDEVARASYAFLPDHLRNWFDHLDSTPQVAAIVQKLEHGLDIDGWIQRAMADSNQGRSLDWGSVREKSLGMKLLLFRAFANKRQDIAGFGLYFIRVGENLNDNARAFVDQVFSPMAGELRRFLEGELARPEIEKVLIPVPASDRSVTIDHNSPAYADAEAAMEKLEAAIHEANDFPDLLEKEQREAEVSAARRLLSAALVRLEPLVALLRPILVEYGTKVKDGLIAHAATATVAALIALLGVLAPLFRTMLGL
jgi:hypothetical protein